MSAKARAFRRHVGGDLPAGPRFLLARRFDSEQIALRRVRHRPYHAAHGATGRWPMVSGLPPKL